MNVPGRISGLRFLRGVVLFQMGMLAVLAVLIGVAFVLNSDRVDQINSERAANVQRSCQDTNQRHDNTIAALDELLDQPGVTPEERRQARASTGLLIAALVPKRDCRALVAQQVNP